MYNATCEDVFGAVSSTYEFEVVQLKNVVMFIHMLPLTDEICDYSWCMVTSSFGFRDIENLACLVSIFNYGVKYT